MKRLWKFILGNVLISLCAVLIVFITAYLLKWRWFMAVGSIICLLIIWVLAIMGYETDLEYNAQMEAKKMLGMKKKNIDMLEPVVESAKKEISLDELEVPTPPAYMKSNGNLISDEDKVLLKIKGLKAELKSIDEKLKEIEENSDKLDNLYAVKQKALVDEAHALEESKKTVKDKILELI